MAVVESPNKESASTELADPSLEGREIEKKLKFPRLNSTERLEFSLDKNLDFLDKKQDFSLGVSDISLVVVPSSKVTFKGDLGKPIAYRRLDSNGYDTISVRLNGSTYPGKKENFFYFWVELQVRKLSGCIDPLSINSAQNCPSKDYKGYKYPNTWEILFPPPPKHTSSFTLPGGTLDLKAEKVEVNRSGSIKKVESMRPITIIIG
jgi:hypothetical protein